MAIDPDRLQRFAQPLDSIQFPQRDEQDGSTTRGGGNPKTTTDGANPPRRAPDRQSDGD